MWLIYPSPSMNETTELLLQPRHETYKNSTCEFTNPTYSPKLSPIFTLSCPISKISLALSPTVVLSNQNKSSIPNYTKIELTSNISDDPFELPVERHQHIITNIFIVFFIKHHFSFLQHWN